MVGITLFCHDHPIHTHVNILKDGVAKIVDAVGVSGIVGIGVSQVGFQSLIPTSRISQTYFDLKAEFFEIVIIVRGGDGKRDGSRSRQDGLKRHVPSSWRPDANSGSLRTFVYFSAFMCLL